MAQSLITANRLTDGVVVWFAPPQGWVLDAAAATRFTPEALAEGLALAKADESANQVVDIHEAPLAATGLDTLRERLRAVGPSVRPDLTQERAPLGASLPPLPSETGTAPFAGIYRYDEEDRQFLRDRAHRFSQQVARRLTGALSEDEFKPLRLMNGLYLQLHGYMLRVAIPYGILSSVQLRQLAYIARHFDRGYGHFTTRQTLQFNWPRLEDTPRILAVLAEADLHGIQTSGNCVRNITIDQFAGAAADELVDPRVYAEILRQWSTDHPEFTYLPRKFKIALTGSPNDRAAVRVHDIGILAKPGPDGAPGFEIYAGGGLGRIPVIGTLVRAWVPVPDLLRVVEAILRVYNALGRRDNIHKARIKIRVREMKPAVFIKMIEEELAALPPDYGVLSDEIIAAVARRFVPPPLVEGLPIDAFTAARQQDPVFAAWVKTNTHPHRVPGYLSAVISLKPVEGIPGDASAAEMDLIADLADRYSFGEIRVSHEQNLILAHVRQSDLPALHQALVEAGLATANIGRITDIIACPGMDYCSLATARSIPVAQALASRFAAPDRQDEIGPITLNISGCINACGHHHVGHIGLLGVDKGGEEFYQITLGGAADEQAAIGAILGPAVASADVPDTIEAILSAYLARRTEGERFIDTYRRLGPAPFKEAAYAAH